MPKAASTSVTTAPAPIGFASWNPPLQDMALRAIKVVPQALKVAEQQPLAKSYETELPDDALVDFKHIEAFFELAATCLAFDCVGFHG